MTEATIEVHGATVRVRAPDDEGDRQVDIWVELDNRGGAAEECDVTYVLRDRAGAILLTDTLPGGAVPPGSQILHFSHWNRLTVRAVSAECSVRVRRGSWIGPVRVPVASTRREPAMLVEAESGGEE